MEKCSWCNHHATNSTYRVKIVFSCIKYVNRREIEAIRFSSPEQMCEKMVCMCVWVWVCWIFPDGSSKQSDDLSHKLQLISEQTRNRAITRIFIEWIPQRRDRVNESERTRELWLYLYALLYKLWSIEMITNGQKHALWSAWSGTIKIMMGLV